MFVSLNYGRTLGNWDILGQVISDFLGLILVYSVYISLLSLSTGFCTMFNREKRDCGKSNAGYFNECDKNWGFFFNLFIFFL